MIYFDAAYIAKCYLNEPGADRVRELAQTAPGLASCEFARIEFFSVVQRHLREAHLTPSEAAAALSEFEQDERGGVWHWLPVHSRLVRETCARLRSLPRNTLIRAADALHLGCAVDNGFREIYTNDRRMLVCAARFRIEAKNVIDA